MNIRVPLLVLAAAVAPAVLAAQVPTAEQLGVPVYPGASYDAQNSAGMSQPTEKYYLFTTGDPVAAVQRFYENATKHQAAAFGDGGAVIIVLEGAAPFPKHGVVIEPNRGGYPPAVKTVITVRREVPEPEGN
jgi:hypothetical protein